MNHKNFSRDHRCLRLEELENRSYLSGSPWYSLPDSNFSSPSSQEQELLEWINLFRADPQGELSRLLTNCDPTKDMYIPDGYGGNEWNDEFFLAKDTQAQSACETYSYPAGSQEQLALFISQFAQLTASEPLALNQTLQTVAKNYTQTSLVTGQVSGTGFLAHNDNLGNDLNGLFGTNFGENVYGNFAHKDQTVSSFIHAAFTIDWGNEDIAHRLNNMNAGFREIGLSIQQNSYNNYYSTVDFGTSTSLTGEGGYLLGVVYSDKNNDGFYNVGEGSSMSGMTVKNLATDETVSFKTFTSGGYQIYLRNGTYEITSTGGTSLTKTVSISGQNVKVDFVNSERSDEAPVLDLGTGESGDYSVVVDYAEGSGAVKTIPNVKITDNDSSFIYQATVTFTTRPDTTEETIDLTPNGAIRAQYNVAQNQWLLFGKGSLTEYQDALATLTYEHSRKEANLTADRVITLAVSDGVHWSNSATVTLTVSESNLVLSVENNKIYEGDDGSVYLVFTALLNHAVRGETPVEFRWTTTNTGTAVSEINFEGGTGIVSFTKGEYQKSFSVAILGNYDRQTGTNDYDPTKDLTIDVTLESLSPTTLTCKSTSCQGTILDDDTPLITIKDSSWQDTGTKVFETEYGTARFVYAVTAPETGLITWSASSANSGSPASGFSITAFDTLYSAEPITAGIKLTTTELGQTLQISAQKGKTYLFVVNTLTSDGAVAVTNQKMAFLPIKIEEEVAVIDLGDANQAALALGDGPMEFTVNNDLWVLGQDELANSESIKFKTSSDEVPLFLVSLDGQQGSLNNTGTESFASRLVLGDQTYDFEGFVVIKIDGSDAQESLTFFGSGNDDELTFAAGNGSFVTSVGESYQQTYLFSNVTNITFNGGTGGEDTAVIADSSESDFLTVKENYMELIGGGYHLALSDFNLVSLAFDSGGTDTVIASNMAEATDNLIASNVYIMEGAMNGRTTGNTLFSYNIRQFSHFTAMPMSDITVAASSNMVYSATPGSLIGNDTQNDKTIRIYEAKVLNLVGFTPDTTSESLTVSKLAPTDEEELILDETTRPTRTVTQLVHTAETSKTTYKLTISGDWTSKIKVAAALPQKMVALLLSNTADLLEEPEIEWFEQPVQSLLPENIEEQIWQNYGAANSPYETYKEDEIESSLNNDLLAIVEMRGEVALQTPTQTNNNIF